MVAVLKNKRDFDILVKEKWYRIPVSHMPARSFGRLAFYQPTAFGRKGKRIVYYAQVLHIEIEKRKNLLPKEPGHPRAEEFYCKIRVGTIKKLPHPIKNIIPRRISFGFTTRERLFASKNILELYRVVPIEKIMEEGLRRAGVAATPQYTVRCGPKRFRLDFAIQCRKGSIAVECDNKKAHSGRIQRKKDTIKNFLLRRCGWAVIRLPEQKIISDPDGCVSRIKNKVRALGGALSS